jgi:type III pantothenate kinase
MKKALGRGTEALRFSEPLVALISPPLSLLSNNTQDAIYNGTLTAAVGLIEHVLNKQSVHLILTGGDAELIANQLEVKCTLDQDLILQGLLYVLEG